MSPPRGREINVRKGFLEYTLNSRFIVTSFCLFSRVDLANHVFSTSRRRFYGVELLTLLEVPSAKPALWVASADPITQSEDSSHGRWEKHSGGLAHFLLLGPQFAILCSF